RTSTADGSHFHLNLVIDNPHLVAAGLHLRRIHPSAVRESKSPGVPGAGDDAVLYLTGSERCPHGRAAVVQGVKLTLMVEYRNELTVDFDDPRFLFRNIADLADRVKLSHLIASLTH